MNHENFRMQKNDLTLSVFTPCNETILDTDCLDYLESQGYNVVNLDFFTKDTIVYDNGEKEMEWIFQIFTLPFDVEITSQDILEGKNHLDLREGGIDYTCHRVTLLNNSRVDEKINFVIHATQHIHDYFHRQDTDIDVQIYVRIDPTLYHYLTTLQWNDSVALSTDPKDWSGGKLINSQWSEYFIQDVSQ